MTITLDTLSFLVSSSGEQLLARLADEDLSDANTLRLLITLRKDYSPENAGAALELSRLRKKAIEKFGDDAQMMFFTRDALEQASDPAIRRYRSALVKGQRVVDVCCSIGSDSLSFAQGGAEVLGIDLDPVRIQMARLNAATVSLNACFEVQDARHSLPDADLLFFDPGRRDTEGKRIFDVERYEPPLSIIQQWTAPQIWVKLSPGVDLKQLERYNGWLDFISVEGELKEALLRIEQSIEDDRTPEDQGLKLGAVIMRGLSGCFYRPQKPAVPLYISEPLEWLYEPDPAIIRAGLVADIATRYDGFLVDETIAYFTSRFSPDHPDKLFDVRAWRVLDWIPFNLKKLRAYLRERNVGNVTVKKRGTAVTPEVLIPQLKLKGEESRTLVLTRCRGEQVVIICQDFEKQKGRG